MLTETWMEKEARETTQGVEQQWVKNEAIWGKLAQKIYRNPPPFVMTIARGSSDHAATFLKYLFEVKWGIPTVSAAPSVLTIYQKNLNLKGALVVAISQSGRSPDLVEMMKSARDSGALTLALVNQVDSPLAAASEYVVPLYMGEEKAVAATKSYLGSLFAMLHFWSTYKILSRGVDAQESFLFNELKRLPQSIDEALSADLTGFADQLFDAFKQNAVVLGRGFGYPIAQESALKFKETCMLQAESFSSAEFLHGPMGMIRSEFPVLMYLQKDETLKGALQTAERILTAGGKIFMIAPEDVSLNGLKSNGLLALPKSRHPLLDSFLGIQVFYPVAARLSILNGLNPDSPKLLSKVTETR